MAESRYLSIYIFVLSEITARRAAPENKENFSEINIEKLRCFKVHKQDQVVQKSANDLIYLNPAQEAVIPLCLTLQHQKENSYFVKKLK